MSDSELAMEISLRKVPVQTGLRRKKPLVSWIKFLVIIGKGEPPAIGNSWSLLW